MIISFVQSQAGRSSTFSKAAIAWVEISEGDRRVTSKRAIAAEFSEPLAKYLVVQILQLLERKGDHFRIQIA